MKHKIKVIGSPVLVIAVILAGLWQFGPTFLEQIGLYLQKSRYEVEAEERIAGLPMQYVGSHACYQCHQGQHDEWLEAKHKTVDCEVCHGPGQAHIEGGKSPSLETSREACGMCHDQLAARPGSFPQVSLAQHNPQSACIACHNPMGVARQIPHPAPGGTDCVFCHRPEGLAHLPESHIGRAGDVCLICHGGSAW